MTLFTEKVYAVVRGIPKGETLTYAQVALAAGYPGAARAVGTALSRNFNPKVPCHRVIRSDGKPGEYNRGCGRKKRLLKAEGAVLDRQK